MCGGVDGCNSGADKLLRSISPTGVWRPGGEGGGQVQGDFLLTPSPPLAIHYQHEKWSMIQTAVSLAH